MTGSALPLGRPEAGAYEYQPPSQIPYPPKREEINRIIARDGTPDQLVSDRSFITSQVNKSTTKELTLYAEGIDTFFKNQLAIIKGIAASPMVQQSDLSRILSYLDREQKHLSAFIEGLYYSSTTRLPRGSLFGSSAEP